MIYAIEGEIFDKNDGKIFLKIECGIIYEINVSLLTFSKLEINEKIVFLITEIIKENEYSLYGFLEKEEKKLFDSLLKINGVGPKAALGILSTMTPSEFINAIQNNDINALKKVPGIGPKSAKRIIVEMGEFEVENLNNELTQAIIALENLGFKKMDIIKVLRGEKGSVEELIKKALKRLGR